MALAHREPKNPDDYITIDGKEIGKWKVKKALAVLELVEQIHSNMGHSYIDPPLY